MPTIYQTTGETVEVKREKPFSLEELQKLVGGYIELVPVGKKYLVVNEEGRILDLPLNVNASALVAPYGYDCIVGDAVLTEKRWIR